MRGRKKDSTKQRKRTAELLLTCLLLFCTNAAGQNPLIYAAERSSISVNKTAERSSTDGTKAAGADTADGIYTIQGKLWKADEDRASMGNASLTGDSTSQIALFRIRKSGDSTLLQLEFHPLTAIGFTGYLYGFSCFPQATDTEQIPKNMTGQPVTVTEYYSEVYDDYNNRSTGLDTSIRGRYYPHYAVMPVTWGQSQMWVQVYVPVMEALGTGQGTQYAKLLLDWSTLQKTEQDITTVATDAASDTGPGPLTDSSGTAGTGQTDNGTDSSTSSKTDTSTSDTSKNTSTSGSSGSSTLKIGKLKDGTYTIQGNMLKTDKKSKSMSDKAINHNVLLTVKNGSYKLTLTFQGMTVGTSKGYLSKLRYYKSDKMDANGIPSGKTKAATVNTYQKYTNGKKVSDSFGSNYPAKVTFPMIVSAKKKGYVPLQVFVPIMEALSAGSGTQAVYLKLDLSTITAGKKGQTTTAVKENSTGTTSGTGSTATGTGSTTNGTSGTTTGTGSTTTAKGGTTSGTGSTAASGTSASGSSTQNQGKIYSCKIVPGYKHPVDGTIEDSGGESSYATGQGMVESAVNTAGMMEVAADGSCYLTLRMKLMDYTSGHAFKVQKKGASGWQDSSAEVTATGSDSNGKTSDMCIKVPSQDCVVRVTMYVQPMGRNVIFYCYPTDFTEGQPSDMKATKVTAAAAASGTGNSTGTQQPAQTTGTQSGGTGTAGNSTKSGTTGVTGTVSQNDGSAADAQSGQETAAAVQTADAAQTGVSGAGLAGTQGLSLSVTGVVSEQERSAGADVLADKNQNTEKKTEQERRTGGLLPPEEMTMGMWIVVLTVSLTVSGLIILGAGAGLVWHFRRNWRRWGEELMDDDDDKA